MCKSSNALLRMPCTPRANDFYQHPTAVSLRARAHFSALPLPPRAASCELGGSSSPPPSGGGDAIERLLDRRGGGLGAGMKMKRLPAGSGSVPSTPLQPRPLDHRRLKQHFQVCFIFHVDDAGDRRGFDTEFGEGDVGLSRHGDRFTVLAGLYLPGEVALG